MTLAPTEWNSRANAAGGETTVISKGAGLGVEYYTLT